MDATKGEAVIIDGTGSDIATTTAKRYYVKTKQGKETFARQITFRNESAANSLKIGLGGSAVLTVSPGGSVSIPGSITLFTVQSSASTVTWTAIALVA